MKVTQVEPIVLEAPVKEPWRIGTAVYTSMHAALVRIETDEGVTGFGEGLARYSPRAAASVSRTSSARWCSARTRSTSSCSGTGCTR
ncbi:MAG: hypothetical protein ACHQ7N_08910 [Candidatus Methylomirabilales bacterium]